MKRFYRSVGVSLILASVTFAQLLSLAFADGPAVPGGAAAPGVAAPGVAAPPQQSLVGMLVPFALMFAVIYFLMIRPQQKKMKEQQDMLSSLKHGDEVLTASGILGKITGITEKVVTVEIADNVRIKMLKSQVSRVLRGQAAELE